MREPRILSLCSGGGGLEMGLELALGTLRVEAYVEREAFALAVLAEAIEKGMLPDAPFRGNCRTFDATPLRGRIDIVTAGYPCQPYSCAGRRRGSKDERNLWPSIARIVGECQPPVCFFENVGNHLNLGFPVVLRTLQGMGYSVAAGLFTASEVGAPHGRERLFILADAAARQFDPGGKDGVGDSRAIAPVRHPDRPDKDVADHTDGGLARRGISARSRREGQGATDTHRPDAPLDTCGDEELADSAEERQGGQCAGTCARQPEEEAGDRGKGLPLFPPGRWLYDTEVATAVSKPASRGEALEAAFACLHAEWVTAGAWEVVGKARPDLLPSAPESVVRGMAPGMARRVDRISVLGEGVVPLQAAYAFCSLWAALTHGKGGLP